MEVFWANQEKGWVIRTLEDLLACVFVFEYVGKLLTNVKLLLQMKECMEHGDYTYHYAIHLNANWGFKEEINDVEALRLDGQCHHVTKYYHLSVRII